MMARFYSAVISNVGNPTVEIALASAKIQQRNLVIGPIEIAGVRKRPSCLKYDS